jgi:hypothetical protein
MPSISRLAPAGRDHHDSSLPQRSRELSHYLGPVLRCAWLLHSWLHSPVTREIQRGEAPLKQRTIWQILVAPSLLIRRTQRLPDSYHSFNVLDDALESGLHGQAFGLSQKRFGMFQNGI